MSNSEAINKTRNQPSPTPSYVLLVDTLNDNWRPSDPKYGWGLDGLLLDLDADDGLALYYEVLSNRDNSLVVQSDVDLSVYIGKTLLGVHELGTLNVSNGASLSFGQDRVYVYDLQNSSIDINSSVTAAPDSVLP